MAIHESLITNVEVSQLPRNWRADPAPAKLKILGDAWVAAGTSAVLRIPGTLVPGEKNYLLNPRHQDFPKLHIGKPFLFHLDPRLVEKL